MKVEHLSAAQSEGLLAYGWLINHLASFLLSCSSLDLFLKCTVLLSILVITALNSLKATGAFMHMPSSVSSRERENK